MQQQEMSELRQKIAKEKDPDERKKLEKLLTGMVGIDPGGISSLFSTAKITPILCWN